ncbi:MAG: hypothetical protein R3247_04710 [Rhodothermales bacterium]|nr:hypothetical protein [Rhodothermales bacterium]
MEDVRFPALAATAIFLLGVLPAQGQAPEPFDFVEVRVSGTQNVHRSFVHEFWEHGSGGELAAATPFYLGQAEAGIALHRYRAAAPPVPDFDATLLFAGWGVGVEAGSRLRLDGGLRVGNYRMRFEEAAFTGSRNESELALGAVARLSVRPAGPLRVHVSGSYTKVHTFNRLKLWYLSAGLAYRFSSPGWLKSFLR